MTGPAIDYAKLREVLNSPAADAMPPILRQRMEADVAAHEKMTAAIPAMAPSDDTSAQPAPINGPKETMPAAIAPVDVTAVPNIGRELSDHLNALDVAKQNTAGIANKAATSVMQLPIFAMQVGHDMSIGLLPSPYEGDPAAMDPITAGSQIPIRLVSGIGTMMLQGYGLMRGLSYVGKVPIASRMLEYIPMRMREIGLGALVNGGIDALRPDGLSRRPDGSIADPGWLDPSAKIAKPLAELGIPDRLALGVGGGLVGAVVGPLLIGVGTGVNAARAKAVSMFGEDIQRNIRDGLLSIGIDPGATGEKYRVAATFIKNFRKIALNEDLGSVMADQLSREQFIASELRAGSANLAQPVTGMGDLANSGFFIKPDAAVVLPNASSLQTKTVDAVKQAIGLVGKDEFAQQVQAEIALRSADPLAQAAATEEVARRIIARPANTKTAAELVNELATNPSLNTYAHQDAADYVAEVDKRLANMEPGPAKDALRAKVLQNKLFDMTAGPEPTVIKPTAKELRGAEAERIRAEVAANARRRANELPNQIPQMETGPTGYTTAKPLPPKGSTVGNDILAAQDIQTAQAQLDATQQLEQDAKLMAGIFRNNPGGVNVVTNVANDAALLAAQQRLGVKLMVAKVVRTRPIAALTEGDAAATAIERQTDYLIGRPNYNYPSGNTFGKLTDKINTTLQRMAKEASTSIRAPKTTEAFILADGTPIRGGLNTSAMIEKMRLQKPVINGVARGDLALQEAAKFIRLDITEPGKLVIDLPRQISQEQFASLGKAIDTMKFDEVTVNVKGQSKVFQTPIGAVVQDHVADMLPPKSVSSSITPEMVNQYRREGVFAGQAVVLPDGSVGEMIGRRAGMGYAVKEGLTGQEVFVHRNNLTVLPSALAGELRGSNLFASYLSDAERRSLAQLRVAISKGWAQPITKYREFESFANTRGYMAENLRGGKVRLSKVNEGGAEPITFKSLAAAVEWVRKDSGPMAEISSMDVETALGPDRHMGFIGGGGPPPRMNEMVPIDWKRMEQTMESLPTNRGPGMIQTILKPMLPLLRDLDARFGTQMWAAASNVQSQAVARGNFEALWYHGIGGKLPDGVKPLKEIIAMAGKHANQELITDWREADEVGKAAIAKYMTKNELKAAEELGKWYDAAYPALGVGAPFVENYMPRYREAVQSGNPQTFQDFMASVAGDPLKVPKGTDWVSDHIRNGFIDTYNKEAFQVAVQYLRAGAKNRFMKQANDEAREIVRMIADKNPNVALPLANMLQAMGGYEFAEQRAMLNETFKGIMDRLPSSMTTNGKASIAEKLTDWSTSLVYASTMGFRPSLALRNAKDIFVMSYPIYHGPRFLEAIGHALTVEGRQEAMAARVIGNYGGGMYRGGEEAADTFAKLPRWMQNVHEASTSLYDSADEFTRSGTYHAAKFKAQEALATFSEGVDKAKGDVAKINQLKERLIRDSKIYLFGQEVSDEFLRRAANDPELAARYAGKQGADFTNFLYGRGMQARWMRSIGGRMLGQFGSWSMWYADFLTQLVKRSVTGGNKADALGILARHALVNAAILETGKRVLNVDLSRWASYGALFYSGGPGVQIAFGASTLMRGFGDASSFGEDPLSQTRISQGSQMIWQTLPAFVPFHSAFADVVRMANSYDSTDLLAATLGTRVTKAYQIRRKIAILTGDDGSQSEGPFQSTSGALAGMLNNQVTGRGIQPVDLRQVGAVQTTGVTGPAIPAPGAQQPGSVSVSAHNRPLPSVVPPNAGNNAGMETRPTESKPTGGY